MLNHSIPETIIKVWCWISFAGYRLESPTDIDTPKSCYKLMMKYWEENPQKGCSFSDILNTLEEMHEKKPERA